MNKKYFVVVVVVVVDVAIVVIVVVVFIKQYTCIHQSSCQVLTFLHVTCQEKIKYLKN